MQVLRVLCFSVCSGKVLKAISCFVRGASHPVFRLLLPVNSDSLLKSLYWLFLFVSCPPETCSYKVRVGSRSRVNRGKKKLQNKWLRKSYYLILRF